MIRSGDLNVCRGLIFIFFAPLLCKPPEHSRAQHRRQREAHQHRNHHRECHRPSELIHVAPRVSGHECDGHEDDHQRDRGRNDRKRDFFGRLDRRTLRLVMLLLNEAHDVLEHNYRVVDHDANCKRQRQQCHVVQGEIHRLEQGERRDD